MYDVVIIGGGPAGSTLGTLLKKYRPEMKVLILEREQFPREHIGESQLPPIGEILHEMGCWDKVEAANFPIKIGATYRWGSTSELWDFDFSMNDYVGVPRPAKYEGERLETAFQVERAIYDEILLNHAEEMGCEVRQSTAVQDVVHENDSVSQLTLANGETITARYYVDASGNQAILRRKLGVETTVPPSLKNVAFWDYWDNTQWAEEVGVGGTRVQVMSLSHGWIWFIPISPTRSSVGLVTAADYFKQCNMSKEELYMKSLQEVPRIAELLKEGKREGTVRATKDWSFYSNKAYGTNWFLVGESLGFADPILSAGLTLTHRGAQELAYTIIALDEQAHEAEWLKVQYQYFQIKRVQQHIQFANFWYASNGQLSDLRAYTAKIAEESGLNLTPMDAFRWLGTGGFIEEYIFSVGFGGVGLTVVSDLLEIIIKGDIQAKYAFNWSLNKYNMFEANLEGAKEAHIAYYKAGKVYQCRCFVRGNKKLPILEVFSAILKALGDQQWGTTALLDRIIEIVQGVEGNANRPPEVIITACAPVLEFMLTEGWIRGWFDPAMPKRTFSSLGAAGSVHKHGKKQRG